MWRVVIWLTAGVSYSDGCTEQGCTTLSASPISTRDYLFFPFFSFFYWLLFNYCLFQNKLYWPLYVVEAESVFQTKASCCSWRKTKLWLFCFSALQYNSSDTQLYRNRITLGGLQPYTSYTARVRCGAAQHFWRWSEWSKAHTFRTKEIGVSGL